MTDSDLQRIRTAADVTYDNWNAIKSTTSINEIRAYQDSLDETMSAVESWIEWASSNLSKWRVTKGQAELHKKKLMNRQEQAKRLAISLYRGMKNLQ